MTSKHSDLIQPELNRHPADKSQTVRKKINSKINILLLTMIAIGIGVPNNASQAVNVPKKPKWKRKNFCQIMMTNPGQLRTSIDQTVLSSKEFGASSGTADITASKGRYILSLNSSMGFSSMPAGGSSQVTFSNTFSGRGATIFSERPGEHSIKLRKGVTHIKTDFTAKMHGDTFPAGHYSAVITLRCE